MAGKSDSGKKACLTNDKLWKHVCNPKISIKALWRASATYGVVKYTETDTITTFDKINLQQCQTYMWVKLVSA